MAASRRTRNTLAARKLRKGAETIRGIVSARGTLARDSPAAFAKKCGGKLDVELNPVTARLDRFPKREKGILGIFP